MRRLGLIALALAAGGCATIPEEERLTPVELAVACEVTRGLAMGASAGELWEAGDGQGRLDALRDQIDWKPLPSSARCADGRRRFQRRGYGDFLTSFGLSADGAHAAVAGGFQYAALLGGGGECFFERSGDGWRRSGCVETWAS